MRTGKFWFVFRIALLVLSVGTILWVLALMFLLNMLPAEMTITLAVLLGALGALTGVLLLSGGQRKKGRQIFGCVMAVLLFCGCGAVGSVIGDLHGTITEIINLNGKEERGVYVRTEDTAQSLSDVSDDLFGIAAGYDTNYTQQAIELVEKDLGKEIEVREYDSLIALLDALYSGEVRSLILNSGYLSILDGHDQYGNYAERIRKIDGVQIKVEKNDPPSSKDQPKVSQEPFVVYLSGSDSRNQLLSAGNSDVNILAVVNPNTHQVLLLNTPRDYFIPNPAGKGTLDKLTHCGAYGIENSVAALEQLYDLQVDYHAMINFTGFVRLIDAIGGITVHSDASFKTEAGYIQEGANNLDGAQALAFARERMHVAGGDNGRGQNQMRVIRAVIDKLTSGTTILQNYSDILESMEGVFSTNMPMKQISTLVKFQISDMPQWDIKTFAVTGSDGNEITYSIPGLSVYVMHPHTDMVTYAQQLADRVMEGQLLTDADVQLP